MKRLKLIHSVAFAFYAIEALLGAALALMSYMAVSGTDTSGELNFGTALALGIFTVFVVIFAIFALVKIICALLKLVDLIKNIRGFTIVCMVFDALLASLYAYLMLASGDDASYILIPTLALSLLSLILNALSLNDRLRNPLNYYVNPLLTHEESNGQNTLN